MARRTKFTAKTKKAIVEAIKDGNTNETAARLSGISEATLYNWLAQGREQETGPYRTFLEEVEHAEAQALADMVKSVRKAAKTDWKAAGWYLERRRPDEWGKRERLDINNKHSGEINTNQQLDLSKLSEEELNALEQLITKSADITAD